MVWGFCVYFVYMIPLETDVLRKHRFQKMIYLWINMYCITWIDLRSEHMAEILLALYAPFKLFIED